MPNENVVVPSLPSCLARVPRIIIRNLDAAKAFIKALNVMNHPLPLGPYLAFGNVESILAAAKRQQNRIDRGKRSAQNFRKSGQDWKMVFHDIHFYVICWARITKLARFLSHSTRFRRIGLVLKRYHTDLLKMTEAGDHLEHFEERLPGGGKHKTLKAPGDLFNLINDRMTFGGRRYDIGRDNFQLLVAFVGELHDAVLFDSVEVLSSDAPHELSFLLQSASMPVFLRKVTRHFSVLSAKK